MDRTFDGLLRLMRAEGVLVLTGAGCSTESGIPDYRGPETRRRARNPIQHRAFLREPEARARYWARSFVAWPKFSLAKPNAAHFALAQMEQAGLVSALITQNVDRLHHHAGSQRITELHGALSEVRCLECALLEDREEFQARLSDANPDYAGEVVEVAPDGDADIDSRDKFFVPSCIRCTGVLMPNVVFFGGSVPKQVVSEAFQKLDEARALLVVGSSLAVFSGFRFVRKASQMGKPVGLLNLGASRGDPYADVALEGRAGEVLPRLFERLTRPDTVPA